MTAAEKKMIEKNLDLLFEFEKYVLEHPEITEQIPRDAVVFMKLTGDESSTSGARDGRKGRPRRANRSFRLRLRNWAPFIRELKDWL
jgi:hypothetical protein